MPSRDTEEHIVQLRAVTAMAELQKPSADSQLSAESEQHVVINQLVELAEMHPGKHLHSVFDLLSSFVSCSRPVELCALGMCMHRLALDVNWTFVLCVRSNQYHWCVARRECCGCKLVEDKQMC